MASKGLLILHLANNSFSGPLPLGLPATLREISLEHNQLTGAVPEDFARLRDVTQLLLSDNKLTGAPFPPKVITLTLTFTLTLYPNPLP